jgi:UDP-N-acetylglucosamine:LPS N-acetylglucosamine transferase
LANRKLDFAEISSNIQHPASIQIKEFISDMATAYSAADVIVSRAGAIAISELAVAKNLFYWFLFRLQQKTIKPKMR